MPGPAPTNSRASSPKPSTTSHTSAVSSTARRDELFSPKLSPEQVREIRRLGRIAKRLAKKEGRKTPYPGFTRNLADRHGVTMRCIQLILKGQRQTGKKGGRPKNSR